MTLLLIGLVVFFAVHLLPTAPALRAGLLARLGDKGYRTVFSLVSLLGLALVVVGYGQRGEQAYLFAPVPWAYAMAPHIVPLAFVLFAAANMRGYIRHWLRHPMLLGVLLWAGVHLLANGELAATVLFGSFLVYALFDLASAVLRGAVKTFEPRLRYDLMALVGGLVLAGLVMYGHRWLFGVPAAPWGA